MPREWHWAMSATGGVLREELLPLLLHASAALCYCSRKVLLQCCCCKRCGKQHCDKRALLQTSSASSEHSCASQPCCNQALLQPSAAAAKRAASSRRCCKRCCRRCCCCWKRGHPCRHAADLLRYDPFSGREGIEGGRYLRCGGVACTASVEDRKIDRISACFR